MPQKKRITSLDPSPPPKSSRPSRSIQLPPKKIEEEILLPVPVSTGPVLPPKTKHTWWVLFLISLFVFLSIIAVSVSKQGLTPRLLIKKPPENSLNKKDDSEKEKEKVYSYTSVVREIIQTDFYHGTPGECWDPSLPIDAQSVAVPSQTEQVYFLLDVILNDDAFINDISFLSKFVDLANKHKVKLTFFVSESFAKKALEREVTEFASWADQGHEVALLFYPEQYFGVEQKLLDGIPYGSWLRGLHEGQVQAEELCDCTVSTWNGGESFSRLFDVGYDLNFTAYADLQSTFLVAEPWTPGSGGGIDALKIFNPLNSIVYIPSGVYPAHCDEPSSVAVPFSKTGFTFLTKALYSTMESAAIDRVNVFQAVLDFSSFGQADKEQGFKAWEEWMTSVLDPLLRQQSVLSSSSKKVSDKYFSWIDEALGSIEFIER